MKINKRKEELLIYVQERIDFYKDEIKHTSNFVTLVQLGCQKDIFKHIKKELKNL